MRTTPARRPLAVGGDRCKSASLRTSAVLDERVKGWTGWVWPTLALLSHSLPFRDEDLGAEGGDSSKGNVIGGVGIPFSSWGRKKTSKAVRGSLRGKNANYYKRAGSRVGVYLLKGEEYRF